MCVSVCVCVCVCVCLCVCESVSVIFVLSLFFLDVQVFDFRRSPFHVLSKRLVCLGFFFPSCVGFCFGS